MTSFLFATLGSVGFWIAYFVIGSIVGTITLKSMAPDSFKYLTKGIVTSEFSATDYTALIVLHYLSWPIILFGCLIYLLIYMIVKCVQVVIWPVFHKWILVINKTIPTVTFNKKEEKEEKDEVDCSGTYVHSEGGFVPTDDSTTNIY